MRLQYILMLASALLVLGSSNAYYNITSINTTIILNANTSAHVVETFTLFVSNSSVNQYMQNRDAVGISLSDWQNIIYNPQLTQHIVNIRHSAYGFTFLPGPLSQQLSGGEALMTMSYYLNNVTTVVNKGPRRFEYTFNDSVFNFEHTASGQMLPNDARLNMIVPRGSYNITVNPLPDLPPPKTAFINNYNNFTSFSWFSGEPLSQLSFIFTIRQSLQGEVLAYFRGVLRDYSVPLYLVFIAVVAIILTYVYMKAGKDHARE